MTKQSISEEKLAGNQFLQVVSLLIAIAVVWFLLGQFWPVGPDYYFTFRPAAESVLAGETSLYDEASRGYYNAPWAVFLLAPLLLFSDAYGQALLSLLTLGAFLFSIHSLLLLAGVEGVPIAPALMAILTLHTFDLLIRGNLEGFLLLGLGLAWRGIAQRRPFFFGIALVLLTIKPVNIVVPMAVLLYLSRKWRRFDQLKVLFPLISVVFLSFIISGIDWPLRYWQALNARPPHVYLQTSLWRAFAYFGLPRETALWVAFPILLFFLVILIRDAEDRPAAVSALAIATNLVITPYALGSHYVLLAPALVLLTVRSHLFLLLWLLTLTPLLRLAWGPEIAWLDLGYPLAIALAMLILLQQGSSPLSRSPEAKFAVKKVSG